MDTLAKFVTFCLTEVADPWVVALLVLSAALDRGRRSSVGLDAANEVIEAALRRESLFFLVVPGSKHSSVVRPAARVAPPLAACFYGKKRGNYLPWNMSRRRLEM